MYPYPCFLVILCELVYICKKQYDEGLNFSFYNVDHMWVYCFNCISIPKEAKL